MPMPTPKTALLLVILLTAAALAAAACNWWPGSDADEPESSADRATASSDRSTDSSRADATRSADRSTPTRFNFPTRRTPSRSDLTPTPSGRDDNDNDAGPPSSRPDDRPASAADYAACLDQIGLLTAVPDNELEHFIGVYRCRHLEPTPPPRWNPRCVRDESGWYLERYGADNGYDIGNIAYWYGLAACIPDYVPEPPGDAGSDYAACLDHIALLLSNHRVGDGAIAAGPYRCRHLAPAPPQRWNPRCVHDAAQWYQERYESGSGYDVGDLAFWYGLVICVPDYIPTRTAGADASPTFAACLDEIALLMAGEWRNTASFAIAPYRCRHQEPAPPPRWNPRCVHDAAQWYLERYRSDDNSDYDYNDYAAWYGLAVCTPNYAP